MQQGSSSVRRICLRLALALLALAGIGAGAGPRRAEAARGAQLHLQQHLRLQGRLECHHDVRAQPALLYRIDLQLDRRAGAARHLHALHDGGPRLRQRVADNLLEIGFGGGRTAWYLHKHMPKLDITCVELDPAVVDLAQKHFGVKPEDKFKIVTADGRSYLTKSRESWNVIMIDAYRGPFVPFHLLTEEFYKVVKSKLKPGGVVVQNVEPSTMMFDSAITTISKVFANVEVLDAGGNIVTVAYDGPKRTPGGADGARRRPAAAAQLRLSPGRVPGRAPHGHAQPRQGADRRLRARGVAAGHRQAQPQARRVLGAGGEMTARGTARLGLLAALFVIGFALMGFEMLGSRYLNPYFGGGITTWACLISVVLFAMMVGYFAGGYAVDAHPGVELLALCVVLAAACMLIVPPTADPVLQLIIQTLGDGFLGVLVASLALSLVPVAFLSACSPFVVRLLLVDLELGRQDRGPRLQRLDPRQRGGHPGDHVLFHSELRHARHHHGVRRRSGHRRGAPLRRQAAAGQRRAHAAVGGRSACSGCSVGRCRRARTRRSRRATPGPRRIRKGRCGSASGCCTPRWGPTRSWSGGPGSGATSGPSPAAARPRFPCSATRSSSCCAT